MSEEPETCLDLDARVDAARATMWRDAVLELRYAERRRRFPLVVHVGRPAGRESRFELTEHRRRAPEPLDQALRSDVVAALVDRWVEPSGIPVLWLTRCGSLGPHDEDAAWLLAARTAYGEADLDLRIAVVTHTGWYDPRTWVGRRWKRLRRQ